MNVLGIVVGNFYGDAKKGVTIQIDLVLVKGTANFYIKDAAVASQKELRVKYSLKSILFASSLAEDDVKILTF